jgi:hypothetical protein
MEFELGVGLEYFVDDERVRADAELRDKLSCMFERTDASIANGSQRHPEKISQNSPHRSWRCCFRHHEVP